VGASLRHGQEVELLSIVELHKHVKEEQEEKEKRQEEKER
ncbi:uncharacterized protein, partial [Anabrus simplex]